MDIICFGEEFFSLSIKYSRKSTEQTLSSFSSISLSSVLSLSLFDLLLLSLSSLSLFPLILSFSHLSSLISDLHLFYPTQFNLSMVRNETVAGNYLTASRQLAAMAPAHSLSLIYTDFKTMCLRPADYVSSLST